MKIRIEHKVTDEQYIQIKTLELKDRVKRDFAVKLVDHLIENDLITILAEKNNDCTCFSTEFHLLTTKQFDGLYKLLMSIKQVKNYNKLVEEMILLALEVLKENCDVAETRKETI